MSHSEFDRAAQNIGNIVSLEHVNVRVPRQDLATQFYVIGLGMTRDPYMRIGLDNMWINIGENQIHMPTGEPQVLRGTVHIKMPRLDQLLDRLKAAAPLLEGTAFAFEEANDHIVAWCPWGNRYACHDAADIPGDNKLGIPITEFPVPAGSAEGIARFYREIFGATSRVDTSNGSPAARITVGRSQELMFRESDEPLADYDGHHVAIYISDFGGPYQRLAERNLLTRNMLEFEYRFQEITDLDSGESLFTLEHEVRSVTHPIYARPLINRNPAQIQATYSRGQDAFYNA